VFLHRKKRLDKKDKKGWCCDKILALNNLDGSNSSHGSQTYSNHMESQCLVDTIILQRLKLIFIIYFHFLIIVTYIFWHKYILTLYHKKFSFLAIDLFGFWPTIICKNIVKILHNNDMVEIQTWDPQKTIQCDNNLGPFIMSFDLITMH
jgi:hypothetical protein